MKAMKKPTHAALAAALGIDPALVTRYRRRGMPVHSIEAAQQWRDVNLRVRFTPERDLEAVERAISGEKAVKRVIALHEAAGKLLDSGGDVYPLLPTISAAMADVPPSQRNRVLVVSEVMDLLVADLLRIHRAGGDVVELTEGDCYPCGDEGSDEAMMGAFWYSVAAGELRLKNAQS